MPHRKRDVPRYDQTHPPHLATHEALKAEGLKPAPDQLPDGLLVVKTRDQESLRALYARAGAVPIEAQPEAS